MYYIGLDSDLLHQHPNKWDLFIFAMAHHCDQPQIPGLQTLDNLAGSDGRHNAAGTLLHLSRIRRCSPVAEMTKTLGSSMWTNGTMMYNEIIYQRNDENAQCSNLKRPPHHLIFAMLGCQTTAKDIPACSSTFSLLLAWLQANCIHHWEPETTVGPESRKSYFCLKTGLLYLDWIIVGSTTSRFTLTD